MENKHEFTVGNVVQLKSGGPQMTVTNLVKTSDGQPIVQCTFFIGGKMEVFGYPPECLQPS